MHYDWFSRMFHCYNPPKIKKIRNVRILQGGERTNKKIDGKDR